MGLKTVIFLTGILLTFFIVSILFIFHFTIAGALVWDGNVCPKDEYFSKCVQLHSYFLALVLTLFVETLLIVLASATIVAMLFYYFCCDKYENKNVNKNVNKYNPLETNVEKQFGIGGGGGGGSGGSQIQHF